MRDTVFFRQAELVLKMLPLIYREGMFALKGGTAINFFIRDLPRLSVDIDLTYLPVDERGFALDDINRALLFGFFNHLVTPDLWIYTCHGHKLRF
jgi:hypothetical protein